MDIERMKNCDDVEIIDEGVTIIAYCGDGKKVIVPYRDLKWRNPYEDGDDYDLPLFLTLKEIGEQLAAMNYKPSYFVWLDMGLSGKIYQFGNHPEYPHWVKYGETVGDA